MFNSEFLRRLRRFKKITQEELGRACHMSQSLISLYEHGSRDPDTDALKRLSDYFNVPADLFLQPKHTYPLPANFYREVGETDLHPIAERVRDSLAPLKLEQDLLEPLLLYVDHLAREKDSQLPS